MNIEDKSSPQPTPEAFFDGDATNISIPQSAQDVKKKIMHKSRAPVSAPYASPTAQNVVTNIKQAYKPTFSDKTLTSRLATQIALTNEQAGIEAVAFRHNRIKNHRGIVQSSVSVVFFMQIKTKNNSD